MEHTALFHVTSLVGAQLAACHPIGRNEKNISWTTTSQDMESNNIISGHKGFLSAPIPPPQPCFPLLLLQPQLWLKGAISQLLSSKLDLCFPAGPSLLYSSAISFH